MPFFGAYNPKLYSFKVPVSLCLVQRSFAVNMFKNRFVRQLLLSVVV